MAKLSTMSDNWARPTIGHSSILGRSGSSTWAKAFGPDATAWQRTSPRSVQTVGLGPKPIEHTEGLSDYWCLGPEPGSVEMDEACEPPGIPGRGMSRKRKADDSSMEPSEDIIAPRNISIVEFAESRGKELQALSEAVWKPEGSSKKRVFQTLPKHMRRRAMSHNVKRLPHRLRKTAARNIERHNECKKASDQSPRRQTKAVTSKRPSRKHRRRPKKLLEEYNRRQRKHIWLETHIWHAKRFKMVEKWGYRLALHPTDKSCRAAYRAATRHALLQDISYYCCIEVTGPQQDMVQGLAKLTNTDAGLTMAAKTYMSGKRQGTVTLYVHDQYPLQAIGPVHFLWKPENVPSYTLSDTAGKNGDKSLIMDETALRQLWIWVHPACYTAVIEQLKIVFSAINGSEAVGSSSVESGSKEGSQPVHQKAAAGTEDDKVTLKNICFTNGRVTVTSLKDEMCRFRLTGPLSQAVLSDTLVCAAVHDNALGDENHTEGKPTKWWQTYWLEPGMKAVYEHQQEAWQTLSAAQSPAQLLPHCVLGLTVRDPRLFLPQKRTKVMNDTEEVAETTLPLSKDLPPGVSTSPLWNTAVRKEVKETKLSDQELNKIRSQQLVPGTQVKLGLAESRIPLILIQNPGNRLPCYGGKWAAETGSHEMLGHGCGWDIILPAGWAMSFWVALVYRGARVGGLREMHSLAAEQCQLYYPDDYPDTPGCQEIEQSIKAEIEGKYNRMPPAKRPNYVKLGIATPFHYPWTEVVEEWAMPSTKVIESCEGSNVVNGQPKDCMEVANDTMPTCSPKWYVLRSKQICKYLNGLCKSLTRHKGKSFKVAKCDVQGMSLGSATKDEMNTRLVQHKMALVAVRVDIMLRGSPVSFAVVCLPTKADLDTLAKDSRYAGPIEPKHKDSNKKRGIKNKKQKRVQYSQTSTSAEPASSMVDPTKSHTQASELPTPSAVNVTRTCSRRVIGFVKSGSFSFSNGHGCAKAFVALPGLIEVLADKSASRPALVLVRCTTSLQYRFASLSLLED